MTKTVITISLCLAFLTTVPAFAQESGKAQTEKRTASEPKSETPKPAEKSIGFVDADGDGVNDRFVDADGDGKNDENGKAYPHRFKFKDKNKDGINDLWIDQDGDGVNDLSPDLKGKARQERHRNVLDVDEDGHNDVTGERYDSKKHEWHGERWGFWNEHKGTTRGRMVDENANGIDDRIEGRRGGRHRSLEKSNRRDVFVDEDGDGICDGRGDVIRMMGRSSRGDHGRNKMGGHHRP